VSTPPGQPTAPAPKGGSGLTLEQLIAQSNSLASQAISGSASANSGKIQDSSEIFMGTDKPQTEGNNPEVQHGIAMQNNLTYAEARMLPRDWMDSDPDKVKQLVNLGIMNKVPGFDVGMGLPEILSAWDDLVQASYALNQNTKGKKWSPFDVLDTYSNSKMNLGTVKKGDWMYDVATGEKLKYVGPKNKTTVSRDINLSDTGDVKALTTQVLTQALGRAPTAKEVAQYKSTINAQESANPNITTTTSTLNDQGETVAQSNKTTGGFDASAQQQLVQDQAAGSQEYGKYQSATTYWNAMMQTLTGG